jgi:outer membrane protein OmpA-like peptidoglycan-associated protein
MRMLTRLLVVACGYAVLTSVTAAAQVLPAPTPHALESVTIDFTPASARLSNIAKAKLDEVALMMKQEPDARAQVIGYAAPNEGSTGAQQLADERASATKNYLVTRYGIDPSRITTSGEISSGGVCAEGGRCAVLTLTVPQ